MQSGGSVDSTQNMDRLNYGGFLYFDATYGELSILLQGGYNSYQEVMTAGSTDTKLGNSRGLGSEMSLGFSLLGKYPFALTEKITLFPLLGIEYQIALLEWRRPDGDITYNRAEGKLAEDRDKSGNPYPLSAWNSFWIDIGAGLDYTISGPLYVRGELLFGFRLMTAYETGALEMTKKQFGVSDPELAGLTGSPSLKIGVGYRFY
jgi:hypothetical protein